MKQAGLVRLRYRDNLVERFDKVHKMFSVDACLSDQDQHVQQRNFMLACFTVRIFTT